MQHAVMIAFTALVLNLIFLILGPIDGKRDINRYWLAWLRLERLGSGVIRFLGTQRPRLTNAQLLTNLTHLDPYGDVDNRIKFYN